MKNQMTKFATALAVISIALLGFGCERIEVGQRWESNTNDPFMPKITMEVVAISGGYVQYEFENGVRTSRKKLVFRLCYVRAE